MDNSATKLNDEILKAVGLELMFCTPEKCSSEFGITAIELARKLSIPTEVVKKKLKILADASIIRVKGINPKCWKFDEYKFQRMNEDDPIYKHLCSFDDVDFDKYFNY